MTKENFITSWSGGKDSCFATLMALSAGHSLKGIMTMLNENGKVSRSHAIPLHILQMQAAAMNVPLLTTASTWNEYEEKFITTLKQAVQSLSVGMAVFGDIDIDANRQWEEKVAAIAGVTSYLPLWQNERAALVHQMIDNGIEAIIISCNPHLGKSFLGKTINNQTVEELENAGVDICGENGEFHTLVVNCPLFSTPIAYSVIEKKQHEQYCFLEIQ